MSRLIIPSRRIVQPQGLAIIDTSNPLSRGLLAAFCGDPNEVVARKSYGQNYSRVVTRSGVAHRVQGSGSVMQFWGIESPATSSVTIAARITHDVLPTGVYRGMVGKWDGLNDRRFAMGRDGYGTLILSAFNAGGDLNLGDVSGASGENTYSVSAGPGVGGMGFLNGQLIGTSPGSAPAYDANSDSIWVGTFRSGDMAENFLGAYTFWGIWTRALSPQEHRQIALNPWQLFRPVQRRILVSVPAGGGTAYTLTADGGSYSLSGQTATTYPTFKRALTADAGTYTYSGLDAALSYTPGGVDYGLLADAGGYTSSGQDATLTVTRKYRLTADAGSLTTTGQAANLFPTWNLRLSADAGSYSLTGQDATLAYMPGSGAYTLVADPGTYTTTGQPAGGVSGRRVDGAAGALTATGNPAALLVARRLPGAAGTYQITGSDATLTFVGVMAYTLSGETGTYTLNGSPATMTGPSDISTRRGGWAPEMPRRKKERVDRILDDVLAVLEEQKEPERVVRRAKKTLHRVARAEQVQNLAELDTKVDLAEVEDAVTRVIHKAIKEAKVKRRRKQDEELLLML